MTPTTTARTATRIEECRSCHSSDLVPLYSLGDHYVSDFVRREDVHSGLRCPVEVVLCRCCSLVQQRYTVTPDLLYTGHYWYSSSQNQTMRDALRDVTRAVEGTVTLLPGDVVLDIGSNDGTLLRSYDRHGAGESDDIVRVGVEPAKNFREVGRDGLTILVEDLWRYESYEAAWGVWEDVKCVGRVSGSPVRLAKAVTAVGMLYDLDDPNAFLRDVARVLRPDGVFVAQLMTLRDMVESNDVGNLCHEHLEFYSLTNLGFLMNRNGLWVYRVERNNVNGRSTRVWACKSESPREVEQSVWDYLAAEDGLGSEAFHQHWFSRCEDNRHRLLTLLNGLAAEGKTVWGMGASTKGNTLLQWWGLSPREVRAIADKSPEKWGKWAVGTGIPIFSEETMRLVKPDYVLVLPWGFRDEFLRREQALRDRGTKFIFPLPTLEVV